VFHLRNATFSAGNINEALRLYSQTRQPHTDRLLRIVHSQIDKKGTIFATDKEEDAALVARMTARPDTVWLSEHDVEAAFNAVEQLEGAQRQVRLVEPTGNIGGEIQLQGSKL
jgi:salicylate hydroxylase